MARHGFVRVAAVSPQVSVGAPQKNRAAIREALSLCGDADVVVFPELCLTGYTAADLFGQAALIDAASEALHQLMTDLQGHPQVVIVGLPLAVEGSLYNVAAVIADGVRGFVPKQYLPTYSEFYEARWFHAANGDEPALVNWFGQQIPFGIDLLFDLGVAKLGIEICEDLWVPTPPSGYLALAGAELLVNLSASTEVVAKAPWRTQLVQSQSGRCLAGYVYASSGPTESTTDVVFGGHCLIAENGSLLSESRRVGDGQLPWKGATVAIAEIDIDRLKHDRRVTSTFGVAKQKLTTIYREVSIELPDRNWKKLYRGISGAPFVPQATDQLDHRCAEIFGIQTAALAKRVSRLPEKAPLVIGVSGGLDSTLALLAAVKACDAYGWPRERILGITMPGFGTSQHTWRNGTRLLELLGLVPNQ